MQKTLLYTFISDTSSKLNREIKRRAVRPCQIGILLSVDSSLTNLGTYSQKQKTENENTFILRQNNALYIYLIETRNVFKRDKRRRIKKEKK